MTFKDKASFDRWYKKYKLEHREQLREYFAKHYKKHRGIRLIKSRAQHLKKKYGITIEQYDVLNKAQNGLCAVCGKPERSKNNLMDKTKMLAVDHDHITGKIRGLLCSTCNTGIGGLQDSIELLEHAAAYLKRHRQ